MKRGFIRDSIVCAGVVAALFILLSIEAFWTGFWPLSLWPVFVGMIAIQSLVSGPMLALFWRYPVRPILRKFYRQRSSS